jgi:hypothetical protein
MRDCHAPNRAALVAEFDRRFHEMDRALWCLSRHSRQALLAGESSPVVEALVKQIKLWWGIQGPDHTRPISLALAQASWTPELFAPTSISDASPDQASDLVLTLVQRARALGASRNEVSWASKTLHWLLPWRVPVYDRNVRVSVGVPEPEDPRLAYRVVARRVFAEARAAAAGDPAWRGPHQPSSVLRAVDKCLWLRGGDTSRAIVDRDPWRVARQLGLEPDPSVRQNNHICSAFLHNTIIERRM